MNAMMTRVERAASFFESNGRDVDKARFAYHFGNGSREDMLEALGRYQNEDGGFGHALEVDIKAPESNPFATSLALQMCLQADVLRDHPLLQRTVDYLEHTQTEDGDWRFSPAIYQHELAPWFQGWEFPALNPACVLAGVLKELGLGSERLHTRVEQLFARLARVEELTGDEFYALQPYAFYFPEGSQHPQRGLYRSGVLWWLIRQHVKGTLPDASHFFVYVRDPRTYTGTMLPSQIVTQELDRLEAEQQEDGGWPTPYSDGWRGYETVQCLLVLKEFGRL